LDALEDLPLVSTLKNVVILTSGLSGSSPLTGLLTRAGYWTGSTFKKSDYDTYENVDLIELNKRIFREANFDGKTDTFSAEAIDRIASLGETVDSRPFRDFVRSCNEHRPWIWKDPRLWLTIRFWNRFLDLDSTSFLLLTREDTQAWISMIIRRQIWTYACCKRYAHQINASIEQFLRDSGTNYHELCFEELIVRPHETISALNGFLGTHLGVEDLEAIYTKPLYRRPRGFGDFVKASLIYAKNYGSRRP
jgi:hypothetical protein